MKIFLTKAVIVFFLMFTAIAISFAQDTAMVIDLKQGKAFFETGSRKGQAVMLLDFPEPGSRIRLEANAVLVLNYFASGIREEITGPGKFRIGKDFSKKLSGVKISKSETDYLPPEAMLKKEDVQQVGADVLRREEGEIAVFVPADMAFRSSSRISFRWQSVKGAENYVLRIYHMTEDTPCFETKVSEPRFVYGKPGLKAGGVYKWRVSALANGKDFEGEDSFSILDKKTLNKVIRAEKKIRTECPDASDEMLTRLAMIYRFYDLNSDAADMLRKLLRRHPQNQNIRRWLRMSDPGCAMNP